MKKPSSTIKQSFKLRKPSFVLSKKRAVSVSTVHVAAVDVGAKVLRLFTDKKPNQDKFAARPFVTKGMTLDKLLAKTRPAQIELSANVVIKNVRKLFHKKTLDPVIVAETYSKKTGKGTTGYDKYVTYVEALHTKKSDKFSETLVHVGCSCPFFLFYAEYALHKYNAAEIRFSNGEPPVVRNPKERPLLCKHLVKLIGKIHAKGI